MKRTKRSGDTAECIFELWPHRKSFRNFFHHLTLEQHQHLKRMEDADAAAYIRHDSTICTAMASGVVQRMVAVCNWQRIAEASTNATLSRKSPQSCKCKIGWLWMRLRLWKSSVRLKQWYHSNKLQQADNMFELKFSLVIEMTRTNANFLHQNQTSLSKGWSCFCTKIKHHCHCPANADS